MNYLYAYFRHGANVNLTDMQNRSVFHWAMKIPNVTCLKHLCKYASFDIENQSVSIPYSIYDTNYCNVRTMKDWLHYIGL